MFFPLRLQSSRFQHLTYGFYNEEVKMPQHLGRAWRTTKPSLDKFWGTATIDGHWIPCSTNSHRLGQFSRPWANAEDPSSLSSNGNVLLLSIVPWFSHHGNGMIMLTLTCKFLQDLQVKALRVNHCYCLGLNIRLMPIIISILPQRQWQSSYLFWWYRLTCLSNEETGMPALLVGRFGAKWDFF